MTSQFCFHRTVVHDNCLNKWLDVCLGVTMIELYQYHGFSILSLFVSLSLSLSLSLCPDHEHTNELRLVTVVPNCLVTFVVEPFFNTWSTLPTNRSSVNYIRVAILWIPMDSYEFLWIPMDVYGFLADWCVLSGHRKDPILRVDSPAQRAPPHSHRFWPGYGYDIVYKTTWRNISTYKITQHHITHNLFLGKTEFLWLNETQPKLA
jgi:hypothetical protein